MSCNKKCQVADIEIEAFLLRLVAGQKNKNCCA